MEGPNRGEVVLPEDLVERIVAMIPYPSIYKARCLSKSWLRKFSSITSSQSKQDKSLAISFQKMVGELSKDWPTGIYPPAFHGEKFSYSDNSKRVVLPSLKFLPEEFPTPIQHNGGIIFPEEFPTPIQHNRRMIFNATVFMPNLCFNGILLRWTSTSPRILYVANIFNHSWKKLPRTPSGWASEDIRPILVSSESLDAYKVVVFGGKLACWDREPWVLNIFDSKSSSWTRKTIFGSEGIWSTWTPVYLNGFVYVLQTRRRTILRINLEEDPVEELRLVQADEYFNGDVIGGDNYHLVVCNGELFMIVTYGYYSKIMLGVECILKVDLVSLQVSEVTRYHATDFAGQPFSVGHHIFVPVNRNGLLHVYDVTEDRWSRKQTKANGENFPSMCFQPGWNPFLAL